MAIVFSGMKLEEYNGPIDDIDEDKITPIRSSKKQHLGDSTTAGLIMPAECVECSKLRRETSQSVDIIHNKLDEQAATLDAFVDEISALYKRIGVINSYIKKNRRDNFFFAVSFTLAAIVIIAFSLISMIMSIENRKATAEMSMQQTVSEYSMEDYNVGFDEIHHYYTIQSDGQILED